MNNFEISDITSAIISEEEDFIHLSNMGKESLKIKGIKRLKEILKNE